LIRFEGDDLSDVRTGDGGFAYEVRRTFLDDVAVGAETRGKEQARIARLKFQALPDLLAGKLRFAFRVHGNGSG
jgi:hypothetical protein